MPYIHRSSVIEYLGPDGKTYDEDKIKQALAERPKKLLKQNEKMKHSNGELEQFFNVGFAALTGIALDEDTNKLIIVNTCPGAGSCKIDCFAMKGGKVQFKAAWQSDGRILTYLLNDPDGFFEQLSSEITKEEAAGKKGGYTVTIRWHDAGDFFSPEYLDLALKMAAKHPNTKFYAYTKMAGAALAKKPDNFIINWSEGAHTSQEKKVLQVALGVSFDQSIGHDFIEDAESRFDFYHRRESRTQFDLDFFNKITKNGVPKKTLNVVMAGVGVGKSLFLCHLASSYLNQGKNVLYITLELAEEEVSKRIDANLMNITFDDLMTLPKDLYQKKIENLKSKTHGKLIVKEYPTSSASTVHFRSLLNELNLKKGFMPDAIMIDYLNICSSARIKPGVAWKSLIRSFASPAIIFLEFLSFLKRIGCA